ncbi:MAG: hypothetical protein OEV42_15310 [Deltaproteobacteria bacterium]|nr:hypothetical protein [Deltaproteobacteria bacterium]
MNKKTSIAKIAVPVPGDILERERLYSLLDHKRPLTWISAPGGSGKTTLAASYLRSRNIPHIWYRLDSGDGDIATFFHYLGLAAKKAAPRRKKPLPHLTPEFMMGIPTFARRFFEELCSRLKPPSVIVFDNYHEVSAESDFHDIINSGLSVLPDGIFVIIMSRVNPPEVFSRLQLNRQMTVIGWETLQLDIEETAGLVRLTKPALMESHLPQVLHRKTGGWLAGLILMLESVHLDKLSAMPLSDNTPEAIFSYFAHEIFYRLDEETRVFLLKTAFMPAMTTEMAKELTRVKQARRILSDLYGSNSFTEKRMQSPPVYQYHPLFRAFLLNEADQYFSEEDKNQFLRRAATLLSQSGQIEEAAQLMIKTGDLEQLIALILKNAPIYIGQGRNRIIEAWILAVPEPVREENPWLVFWLGSCKMAYNMIEARPIFKKSLKLLDDRKDGAGVFLSWCGVIDSIRWGWDDFKGFEDWLDILDNLVKKYGPIPKGEIETRISIAVFSGLTQCYPHHHQFEFWKERALSLQEISPDLNCRVDALVTLSLLLLMRGELKEADEVILSIKSLVDSGNLSGLAIMQARLAESDQANFRGNHEECLKVVDKSLEIARRSGIHLFDVMIAAQALWSSLKQGDLKRADDYMKIIESSSGIISSFERSIYHFLKAYWAIYKKNLPLAEKEISISLQINLEIGAIPPMMTTLSLRAYIFHELGKPKEAWAALSAAIDNCRKFGGKGHAFELHLLKAHLTFHRGDDGAAFKALKTGLAQGRDRGYEDTLFFCLPGIHSNLYAKALLAGIEVEYVQQLIRKGSLLPPEDMTDLENWPWPIKVYTLGQFGLVIDGETIRFSGKSKKKPLDMLKAIISLGGRGVREEDLTSFLWPEAEGDAAHQSFKTTLYRLRKLLRHEKSLYFSDGVVNLDPDYFWVDAWEFERLADKVDLEWRKDEMGSHITKNLEQTERAIRLYHASFLSRDSWQPWTLSMRERLRSKFHRLVKKLGDCHEQAGEYERATHCYQRGIEIDCLAEEFYRSLMKCHHKLGNKAEAITIYYRCKKVLSSSLGIEPSEETVSLFRAL